jgi:hypothetical protein
VKKKKKPPIPIPIPTPTQPLKESDLYERINVAHGVTFFTGARQKEAVVVEAPPANKIRRSDYNRMIE